MSVVQYPCSHVVSQTQRLGLDGENTDKIKSPSCRSSVYEGKRAGYSTMFIVLYRCLEDTLRDEHTPKMFLVLRLMAEYEVKKTGKQ